MRRNRWLGPGQQITKKRGTEVPQSLRMVVGSVGLDPIGIGHEATVRVDDVAVHGLRRLAGEGPRTAGSDLIDGGSGDFDVVLHDQTIRLPRVGEIASSEIVSVSGQLPPKANRGGFLTFRLQKTKSMFGRNTFLPGFQPEGVASAPLVSLTS